MHLRHLRLIYNFSPRQPKVEPQKSVRSKKKSTYKYVRLNEIKENEILDTLSLKKLFWFQANY